MANGDYFFRESNGRQTLCQFVCVQASDASAGLDIQKISRSAIDSSPPLFRGATLRIGA